MKTIKMKIKIAPLLIKRRRKNQFRVFPVCGRVIASNYSQFLGSKVPNGIGMFCSVDTGLRIVPGIPVFRAVFFGLPVFQADFRR